MNRDEYFKILEKIISLITEAQNLAQKINVKNLSQPGIIKEIITAYNLKHRLHPVKPEHDAEDFDNSEIRYEYLSCLEGKSFQFDRVDSENLKRRIKERNNAIFCSVFDKEDQLSIMRIYRVDPKSLYDILLAKYQKSSSTSRHVGITEKEILTLVARGEAKCVWARQ